MSPRHLSRRRAYTGDIPRNVGIPKFLRPEEIVLIKQTKAEHPSISWDDAVARAVFGSVPNLRRCMVSP